MLDDGLMTDAYSTAIGLVTGALLGDEEGRRAALALMGHLDGARTAEDVAAAVSYIGAVVGGVVAMTIALAAHLEVVDPEFTTHEWLQQMALAAKQEQPPPA